MQKLKNKLMNIENRLNIKSLKRVVFSVRYRKSEKEQEKAREALKEKYVLEGNDPNVTMVFITNFSLTSEDSFLYSLKK